MSEMDYKKLYDELLEEKKKMEIDFGQKRAQFRQLYLDCEEQLKKERENSNALHSKISELNNEVDNVRATAQVVHETTKEEYNALIQKHHEEIASLQHICEEARKGTKSPPLVYPTSDSPEPNKSAAEGFRSMMKSAFSKPIVFTPPKSNKIPQAKEEQNLEGVQKMTQMDVDAWKNVVTELEEANGSLQSELEEANKKLQQAEDKVKQLTGEKETNLMNNEKLFEVQKYLDSERSARTDLEMYVAVLNTQKGVLQEDTDKLKRELHNVCRLYEQEKSSHNELKQTWKLANEQFIFQQNKLIFELDCAKKYLTSNQKDEIDKSVDEFSIKLQESVPKDNFNNQTHEPPKTLLETSASFDSVDGGRKTPTRKASPNPSPRNREKKSKHSVEPPQKLGDSILSAMFPAAYHAKQFSEMMRNNEVEQEEEKTQEKPLYISSSSDSDSDTDDLEKAIAKQNLERYKQLDVVGESIEKVNLRKSNSSDDILLSPGQENSKLQEKSLSHGDVSTRKNIHNKTNENEWTSLSQDFSGPCMMCQNYEKQLQRLQKEFMTVKDKEESLADNVKELQIELNNEKDKFNSLEKGIENVSADTKSQMNIYETNQEEVDKQVMLLFNQVQKFQMDMQNDLRDLSESRDRAFAEKTLLKEQLDELKDKQFDAVQLPPDYEEFKQKCESNEEKLKSEIMFLKDQIVAEKFDRENTETVLQEDLNTARAELTQLKHKLNDTPNLIDVSPTQEDLLS